MSFLQKYINRDLPRRIRKRVLPNLKHLPKSRIRTCRACLKETVFLQFSAHEEFRFCVRCGANLRYEMLMDAIRELGTLSKLDVLELDPNSPLRAHLATAASYARSYYRPGKERGSVAADGSVLEDVTNLTLADESVDLIVSSDVLEHVPDAEAAFRECYRVLRPGGRHLFTVPFALSTQRRATVVDGNVVHLVEPPEYHSDPLDPKGILAFWHYGPDMDEHFGPGSGLKFEIIRGPEGKGNRIVWQATKPWRPRGSHH